MKTSFLSVTKLRAMLLIAGFELLAISNTDAVTYDLAKDYSFVSNPHGVWSFGGEATLGGTFDLMTYQQISYASGMPFEVWLVNPNQTPCIHRNAGTNTAYSDGGQGIFDPGVVTLFSGQDGVPDGFALARFTVPAGGASAYLLETSVQSYINGPSSGDTDFHVLKNGAELFGKFLPGNSTSGFTNTVALSEGDIIDFAVGRGADGSGNHSGLHISASLTTLGVPEILSQPASQIGYWGANITLQVQAVGAPPLRYQWYFDGFPIGWATNATLTFTNLDLGNAGQYRVEITNDSGHVTSDDANLVVNPAGVSLGIYPGLTISGTVGKTFGIQSNTDVNATSNWVAVTQITLTQTNQMWFDTNANISVVGPKRFYRVVALP